MGKKDSRTTPRVVCVTIPIFRAGGKVLMITSRTKAERWVLPKGGWEVDDRSLEAAALREALEEAGVHGNITRFVVTIPTTSAIYHVYELDVTSLEEDWLERKERTREWVDYHEALRRLSWKPELVRCMTLSTLAAKR